MSNPTFVSIPPALHPSKVWDHVIAELPYPSLAIDLPSCGGPLPDGISSDTAAINETAKELCDQGKDIIVVMHSYGGVPGSNALKGLSLRERQAQGLKGGVIRLVFIAAVIPPAGTQLGSGDTEEIPSHLTFDKEAGTIRCDPTKTPFYSDLKREVAEYWTTQLQPQAASCFAGRTTYAAWQHIPSTVVICTRDEMFPLPVMKGMVDGAKAAEPNMINAVEEIDSGHFPILGNVKEVVRILVKTVSEGEV